MRPGSGAWIARHCASGSSVQEGRSVRRFPDRFYVRWVHSYLDWHRGAGTTIISAAMQVAAYGLQFTIIRRRKDWALVDRSYSWADVTVRLPTSRAPTQGVLVVLRSMKTLRNASR